MVLICRITFAPVSAISKLPSDANAMPLGEVSPLITSVVAPSDATFQIWLASATMTLPDASTATACGPTIFANVLEAPAAVTWMIRLLPESAM